MRYLSRSMAVLCVAVLLSALPVQAAPSAKRPTPKAKIAASSHQVAASWLGSLWNELSRFMGLSSSDSPETSTSTQSGPQVPLTQELGSCIDPDGCPTN